MCRRAGPCIKAEPMSASASGFYGEVDNAPAGYGQGNSGFSGTPLWKMKQHGLVRGQTVAPPTAKEEQERAKQLEELQVANVLVDVASLGGPVPQVTAKVVITPKRLVRHIIVKDLRKVAVRSKLSLPTTGLFKDHTAIALFAMFDGQSCADPAASTGQAAEWCCKHVHVKLIRNLMSLPPDQVNQTFLKATLIKTFEDLDRDLLLGQPGIQDGCGAALALLVGDHLLTAALGKCNVVLCKPVAAGGAAPGATETWRAASLGSSQGRWDLPSERAWHAGAVVETPDGARARTEAGAEAAVSRSLGDRLWKAEAGGVARGLLRCVPEVSATQLTFADGNPVAVLTAAPVTDKVSVEGIADVVTRFPLRPRAMCGEIAYLAAEALAPEKVAVEVREQCAAAAICFLPPKGSAEELAKGAAAEGPAAKKPKLAPKAEVQSVRLRHLLVRHCDSGQPVDPVRGLPVTRAQAEAEASLRRALRELLQEQQEQKAKTQRPGADARKASLQQAMPTQKFLALCKELSECESAAKGGAMCGDMGWVRTDDLRSFGPAFAETATSLSIGQWSDLVLAPQGVHVVQRIA